jgi:RNA polymerase sigma factor (sigma-70 family)
MESMGTTQEELILLNRARSLNQDALAEIHERYYTPIYRYISFRVSDLQTVEDLTSEVFLRLLNALRDRHAPQNTLQGWLYGVASSVVKEYYRQKKTGQSDGFGRVNPQQWPIADSAVGQQTARGETAHDHQGFDRRPTKCAGFAFWV